MKNLFRFSTALLLSLLSGCASLGYAQEIKEHRMFVNIEDLETAVQTLLQQKLELPARAIEIKAPDHAQALARPQVSVSAMSGQFTALNHNRTTFKQSAKLYVVLDFQNLKNEKARHKSVYPITKAAISWLSGKTLGLDITPIVPVSWQNMTDAEKDGDARIVILCEFSTAFDFKVLEDNDADTITAVAMEFLLKPGDDEADAEASLSEDETGTA